MSHTKILSVLFVLMTFGSVLAQTAITYPEPPPEVIAAATAAFHEYDMGQDFETILKLPSSMTDPIIIARTFDPSPGAGGRTSQSYPSLHVSWLVAQSDFVGTGKPIKRWTFPTTNHSFAVSVYLVHVTGVSIAGSQHIVDGSDIYLARAGGPFEYDGRSFRAIDPDFQLFHLNEEYVFFASSVAPGLYKTDSDRAIKVEGTTLIEGAVHQRHAEFYRRRTKDQILAEAFAAWEQSAASGRRNP